MPTRWLTGPTSENPPLAQTSGYATYCGWRRFSTRSRGALSHVGALGASFPFHFLIWQLWVCANPAAYLCLQYVHVHHFELRH